ncbi:MAG: phospho-N-acetylmuramoyl-pentapeptide-transferase [Eubacteriales bacterium]|nr:phospho-N-acetylmuramoyl-pentapeptide-transferase [Eubacteriales bacterium]
MLDLKAILLYMLALVILGLVCGHFGLRILKRKAAGQEVREEGPESHYKKSGTATFGGAFFIIPLVIAALASFYFPAFGLFRLLVLGMLLFALIGFADDYIKVYVQKGGLSVRQKTVLMLIAVFACGIYYLYFLAEAAVFRLPFVGRSLEISGLWKIVYLLFTAVYLYFMTNAVNLTDGIDGLASSVSIIVALAIAVISNKLGLADAAKTSVIYFALGLAAGLIAFLYFNRHPAKVFMGDTGSLALGAGIALAFLYLGLPWALLFVGFVYIMEALSVVIQVAYFKHSGGKRIFKMTPIHHHFELSGWGEWKIVAVFSLITLVLSAVAYLII